MEENNYLKYDDIYSEDALKQFLKQISEYETLEEEEKRELIRQYQNTGTTTDKDIETRSKIRNRIIESDLKWVVKVANKKCYDDKGLTLLDRIQEGSFGLAKAVSKFDLNSDTKFLTYATYWIEAFIKRALESQGKSIRVPENKTIELNRLRKAIEELRMELNKEPTIEEIAKYLETDVSKIVELYQLPDTISLDSPVNSDDPDSSEIGDMIGYEDKEIFDNIEKQALRTNLFEIMDKCLTKEEKRILIELYINEKTLEEVGKIFNLSRQRIQQKEERALIKLRHPRNTIKIKDFID